MVGSEVSETMLWGFGGLALGFALGVFVGAWLEYRSYRAHEWDLRERRNRMPE
jgi:hypothetical protein